MNDQNNVNNNGVNNGDVQEKSWFKRTGDAAYDKWQRFKTSKVGRWTGRLLRLGVLAGVAKASYDYGRSSIKPTVIQVEEIKPETAPQEPAQTPATEQPTT